MILIWWLFNSGVFSTGTPGAMPPRAQKKWNLTNFWRTKLLVCNIMNDIRNESPLTAMKLFTTRKRNTVELFKMHNLQNGNYKIFPGIHPASLYLFHGALRLGLRSSPIEIYATIGLGIMLL